MAESMSIQAILSATDSGFSSTMKSAQQAVSGLSSVSDQATKQNKGFMSSVKTVASGIGVYKLASAGLGAISNGFGAVVGDMTESNIAWQTFDGNMRMLGESPKQISKVQKSLQDFATASIYGASDMATTYAQMAALGVDNTEQLVKGMGGLASSAENPQQAMKTLSQQMVQALAKPELQWQDFKLMMEQAPSAMAQVAKHMGMSLDDLILGIQDGEIASKDFAQAVAEVGTNEQFSKLATTYKSTGQALDGMSETLANKLMPAFKALDKIGIKAVEGLSDMIDKVDIEGLVEGFSRVRKIVAPAFREIGKHISKVSDQVNKFFEPMTKGFGEIGKAVRTFGSDMLLAASYIGLGEWGKAWDTVKSSANTTFKSITTSVGNMFEGLWTNIQTAWPRVLDTISSGWDVFKQGFNGVLDWFNNIDWEQTWSGIYDWASNALDDIGAMVAQIDWEVVVGEITGTVGDIVSAVEGWVQENLPIVEDVVKVLLDPESEINEEASDFNADVNKLIGDLIQGLALDVFDFDLKLTPDGDIDWSGILDDIESEMSSWTIGDYLPSISWDTWEQDFASMKAWASNMGVQIKESFNFDDFSFEDLLPSFSWGSWADEVDKLLAYIDQTVNRIKAKFNEAFGGENNQVEWAPNNDSWWSQWFGDNEPIEVEQEIKVVGRIEEYRLEGLTEIDIQARIDAEFGEGTYKSTVSAEMSVELLKAQGVSEAQMEVFIDSIYGAGTYDTIIKVAPKPEIVQGPMDARDGLSSMVRTDIEAKFAQAPTLTPEVKVAPRVTMSGGVGGAEGESGIDLSGITAQITAELESLKATVSSALEGIKSTITSQASSWGTSIASAMTTMVTSVTSTMTAMTLAVTLGMTAMTLAVSMAMTSLAETVTTTMTSMAETVSTTMTSMIESVTQAMTSMAEAITQAMTALVEAVTAGMEQAVAVAQSGAEGIVSAVSGLYDSMYSAGQSAGEGLADGLSAMEGSVRGAASALASAANIAAQATFLINSPSKVWRGFGYSAGEGLVDGFDGSHRLVKKSATRLAVAGLPSIAPFSGRSSHVSVSGNVSNTQQNEELKSELSQIKKAIKEGQVIMLDGNTWVGATVDRIDTALGNNQSLGGRHQLS